MAKRAYNRFDEYYEELLQDIYPQPSDEWHTEEMSRIINEWVAPLGIGSVLDVGCGEGEAQEFFLQHDIAYWGIAQGNDVIAAGTRNVSEADFNFIDSNDNSYDLVFSRHSLEHSPFPLITLMEWHRVSSKWLCLVLPNPAHFTFVGRNHYSVMDASQSAWILRRAGWVIEKFRISPEELWFLCYKMPRLGPQGWAAELNRNIHEYERDIEDKHGEQNGIFSYYDNK